MWSPLLHPPKKKPFSPLQFGPEENIPGHSVERRAYWFVLKIFRVFPIPTGRVQIKWWALLTLPLHVRNSLEDKSMLVHSKKAFLLSSVWPGAQCTWALVWKRSSLIFCKLPGYSLFSDRQSGQRMWTFWEWLTSTLYVRDSLENKSFVYSFLFYVKKKIETWVASPSKSFGMKPTIILSTNWQKHPLVKWTAKYVFFIGVAIKIAVVVSWHTTSVSLC